jgi:peroxiredoxin
MLRSLSLLLTLILCLANASTSEAGKFNKKISIGDAAPSFAGLPGVDGKKYSLADYKDKEVVIVCITCNHCPTAEDYEDRVIAFAKKHCDDKSKVALIAISVSKEADDTLDKMKIRAKEKGYPFPYVQDESQAIGRALGASVTPEFFVFDKNRKIVYTGALDDHLDDKKVKVKHLENVVAALLAGKPIEIAETRPIGCAIEYEKKK